MHKEIEELFGLQDKVALIVGGAVNFGFDICSVLAAAGCDLVITSREVSRAQNSGQQFKEKYKVDFLPLALDHTDEKQVAEVMEKAYGWKKRIDILVNVAGGGSCSGITDLPKRPAEQIRRMIEMNLTGTIICCKEAARFMIPQKSGKIINIASVAGVIGRDRRMYEKSNKPPQNIDYAAAKAGVIAMTMDLAALLAPKGIYVNAISPGGFSRPDMQKDFIKNYSDRTPLGRMGRDGFDLKGAVLYLASRASDYVTGQNLVVDGGFSIWQ